MRPASLPQAGQLFLWGEAGAQWADELEFVPAIDGQAVDALEGAILGR